jgi:hypothetical protein
MNWLKSSNGKLATYVWIAAFGYLVALKDIEYNTIMGYHWWDWFLLISGFLLSIGTTVKAYGADSSPAPGQDRNGKPVDPTKPTP